MNVPELTDPANRLLIPRLGDRDAARRRIVRRRLAYTLLFTVATVASAVLTLAVTA